jgi:CHAT domain-containing protein/tetratricopeptide (TPR) repeat protein
MQRLFLCLIVFFLVILPAGTAYAQCISDAELLEKVSTIHNDTDISSVKKVRLLKALQTGFLKCGTFRNNAYAQLVHRLGDYYSKTDDQERAIFYTKEAVAVNSSDNATADPSFLANSYFNLGIFYKRLNLLRESHYYFDRCIAAGSKFQAKYFIVFMAFEQNAYAYYQAGDYQKSVEVADEGLLFAREAGDEGARAPLLAQRAQSTGELGRFQEGEANVKEAIALLEKAGSDAAHLATSYSVYADLLGKKGNIKASLIYYRKAYELNRANGNLEQCARDLLDLGSVYADDLGQGTMAVYCYNEGVKLARKTNDLYQLAALYSNIGVVYGQGKKYNLALSYYQKALNVLPLNFTDSSLKANLSVNMLNLVSNGYFVTTIMANKGGALLERYKQSGHQEDLKLALATFEVADHAVDVMRWKQYGEQSKLVWRKKTKEMYEQCIAVCFYLKDVEKAYYFFEKSRAVLLSDQLSGAAAEKHIAEKDRNKEKQLRVKSYVLSQKLMASIQKAGQYAQLKAQWRDAQDKWERFIRSLEQRYPAYYQYKYDRSVYPYKAILAKLEANKQSLVEYFTGDTVIYALVLSRPGQKLMQIKYPDYLKDVDSLLALSANQSLLNQNYDRYCALAHEVYKKLFGPLGMSPGRIVISPDNHFIPFDALLSDAGSKTSFLAKQYIFSYVHSMRVLMKKSSAGRNANTFLGVAPVNYKPGSGLSSLQASDRSLMKIATGFKQSKLLTGAEASRSGFLNNLTKYQLLQIYAHANADSTNIEPRLYLADSAVYLSEVQQLNFPNTDLVVLSACNTGIGRYAGGEGVFSMSRAFMTAGVPASLTNLWQVEDKVTYLLTESFYKYLQQGIPKDEALNKAKLGLLTDGDKLYSMPYFWAATILIGNTDAIGEYHAVNPNIWIAIALLVIISALFFLVKRKKEKSL